MHRLHIKGTMKQKIKKNKKINYKMCNFVECNKKKNIKKICHLESNIKYIYVY